MKVKLQKGLPQRTVLGLRMKRCWDCLESQLEEQNQSESYRLVEFEAYVTTAIITTQCTDSDRSS